MSVHTRIGAVLLATVATFFCAHGAKAAVFLNRCPADIDGSGAVDGADLAALLASWGTANPAADLNGDGNVDGADLAALLAAWGGCPSALRIDEPGTMHVPPAAPHLQSPHLITATPVGRNSVPMGAHREDVYHFNGEFIVEAVDLRIAGRGLDFVWARKYRSAAGPNTSLGNGWDFSYNIYIEQSGPNLVLHDGNTRADLFTFDPVNLNWTADEFFRVLEGDPALGITAVFPDKSEWRFHPFDGSPQAGKIIESADRNQNTLVFDYDSLGRLVAIHDTLDTPGNPRVVTIGYNPNGFIETVTDYTGRTVSYEHYGAADPNGNFGDLRAVTSPAVVGTSTLNDFPLGKTTTYTYSTGFADDRLNHNLLTVTDAKGQTYLTNEYAPTTSTLDIEFDRVTRQILGGSNDIIDLTYVELTPGPANHFASLEVVSNDRVGNVRLSHFNDQNLVLLSRDFTGRAIPDMPTLVTPVVQNAPLGPLRASDPPWYDAIYEWNSDALPTRIVHPEQNETRFVYDVLNPDRRSQRNVLEVRQDPGPRGGLQSAIVDLFTYDDSTIGFGSNFVINHTDPRGATTINQYDPNGNLLKTTHRIPTIVDDYTYNAFGQMTSHTLPDDGAGNRRVDMHTYYTPIDVCRNGYLRDSIIDSGGLFIVNTHRPDCVGRVEQETDPLGNETIFEINQLNQIVRETSREVSPGGVRYERDFFYDANDNLVRIDTQNVDENGVLDPSNEHLTVILEYDILDYLIEQTEESGSFVVNRSPPQLDSAGLPDSEFVVTQLEYDANRNRTVIRNGEASEGRQPTNTVTWLYDERDLVFELIRSETDPDQSTTRYTYDANGNLTLVEQGLEALLAGGAVREHTRVYDGYDRVIAGMDPMGNQTIYEYDANHNVQRVELQGELADAPGSVSNVRLHESFILWDPMDRPFQFDTLHFDPVTQSPIGDGASTFVVNWADAGLLLQTTDDLLNSALFTYDTAHRPKTKTDAKGNTVETFYDSNSNVVRVETTELSDSGGPTQQFERTWTYDGLDRLTSAVDGVGNTTTYEYDSRGNTTVIVDPAGNTSQHTYDGLDRLVSSTHVLTDTGAGGGIVIGGVTTQSLWDDSDRLVAEIDANGNKTEYAYDALDRLVQVLHEDATSYMYTYDAHHNRTSVLDPNGTLLLSDYDLNNRLVLSSFTAGPGVSTDTTFKSFDYDGYDRLTSANDDDSTVNLTYDSMSNVVSESRNGQIVFREYDGYGNRTSVTYPSGAVVSYAYDPIYLTRAIDLQKPAQAPQSLSVHDYIGRRPELTQFANGTSTTYEYDGVLGVPNAAGDLGFKRPSRITHDGPSGVFLDIVNSYDARQRRSMSIVDRPLSPDTQTSVVSRDSVARVSETASTPATGATYDHTLVVRVRDDAGNTQTEIGSGRPGSFVLDATAPTPADAQVNQYTESPARIFSYDANGNRTFRLPKTGVITETTEWDVENLMTGHFGAQSRIHRYDAFGRLFESVLDPFGPSPETRTYVHDGANIVEEQDNFSQTDKRFVYDRYVDSLVFYERPLALDECFYHRNEQGSVLALTDPFGDRCDTCDYTDTGAPRRTLHVQEPDLVGAVGSDLDPSPFSGDQQIIADNFIAPDESQIVGFSWLGGYSAPAPTPAPVGDDFTITIYEDAGGLPGPLVYTEQIGDVGRALTGNILTFGSVDEYAYHTTLSTPFHPVAGVTYWLEIKNDTSGDANVWGWETSSSGDGQAAFNVNSLGYQPDNFDVSFRVLTDESSVGNPYLYHGRRYEPDLGLAYHRARWLDPEIGRFTSRDPSGMFADPTAHGNGYTYAANDPASFIDLTGRAAWIPFPGGGAAGAGGGKTDKDQKDWIDVISFGQSIHQPRAGATGATRRRGDVILDDISVVKLMDKSTPKITESICKGKVFPKVEIDLTASYTDAGRVTYYAYELKSVMVSSYQVNGAGGDDDMPTTSVSLNFEEMKVTYTEQDNKGKKKGNVEYSWKIEEGEKCAPNGNTAMDFPADAYCRTGGGSERYPGDAAVAGSAGSASLGAKLMECALTNTDCNAPAEFFDVASYAGDRWKYYTRLDFDDDNWKPHITPYGADGKPYAPFVYRIDRIRDLEEARPHITPYGADGKPYDPPLPTPYRDIPLFEPARPHITPYGADGKPAPRRGLLSIQFVDPTEDEDDPFTNRGDEEEWE